jgi:hypothetical protein
MLVIWPPVISSATTPISRCCASRYRAPGPPLTSTTRKDTPGRRVAQLISVRATRLRPRSGCGIAGTLPPPSPVSSTSCAEERLEPGEIALFSGCEEPPCELVALLTGRLEAGPALARRGVSRGSRAGACCPRSCRRSRRLVDSHSRRRGAAEPLAAWARGSPARDEREAVGFRGRLSSAGDASAAPA